MAAAAGVSGGGGGAGGHMLSSQDLLAIEEIISNDMDMIKLSCGEESTTTTCNSESAADNAQPSTSKGGGKAKTNATKSATTVKQEYKPDASAARAAMMMALAEGKPYVNIVEQPQTKGIRFRYKCEGRSAGSIPGMRSTPDSKSFPAIQIHNYTGPAAVVVSCVTVDIPHKPHPHRLVGKDCREGVCTLKVKDASQPIVFAGIGVQCVKKKEVVESLEERTKIKVDPFQTGFPHAKNIDLKGVRLCFQVFLSGASVCQPEQQFVPLQPIISEAIHDRHTNDLTICKLSSSSCSAAGNKEVILLCEKVNKDDIEIRFYELDSQGDEIWSDFGRFRPEAVHRQVAICFEVPPYRNTLISEPSQAWIELRKPSDKSTSDPVRFVFYPIDHDDERLDAKRRKPLDVEKYLMAQSPGEISDRRVIQGKRRVPSASAYSEDSSSVYSPLQFPMVPSPGSVASSYDYSLMSPVAPQQHYQQMSTGGGGGTQVAMGGSPAGGSHMPAAAYQQVEQPLTSYTLATGVEGQVGGPALDSHLHNMTSEPVSTPSSYPFTQSPSYKAIFDDITFGDEDGQSSEFLEALTSLQKVVDE